MRELSKVQRTIVGRRSTLTDLRIMIETLSTVTSTCASILEDIHVRGQEDDPLTAVKEMGNMFKWTECASTVRLVNALQALS